ncbi:MAG: hypothetical protein Q4C53_00785 [Clostridia bacterium]|nr:hypothetical protein [Clostridia bacterium]
MKTNRWTARVLACALTFAFAAGALAAPVTLEEACAPVYLEPGKTADYKTATAKFAEKCVTKGTAAVSAYEIAKENAERGLEPQEGYEWRTVVWDLNFFDAKANRYGVTTAYRFENAYDAATYPNTVFDEETRYDETGNYRDGVFSVDWDGKTWTDCRVKVRFSWGETEFIRKHDRKETRCSVVMSYLVPEGFDGIVSVLYDSRLKSNTASVADAGFYDAARFLMYRLDGTEGFTLG